MKPIKCNTRYDKTIWAGKRLAQIRGQQEKAGLSWDVGFHHSAPLTIDGGEFDGQLLINVVTEHPEMLGDKTLNQALRMCILNADEALSIQVHPNDDYALEHDNDLGKTESWYVIEAQEGASIVAGVKTCDPDEVRQAIEEDRLMDLVREIPVREGDYIKIPYGTLHALGKGIMCAEVGTNSDTTYRFFDYHRKDANGNERPLHIEKSFDVAHFENQPNIKHFSLAKKDATTIMQVERCNEYYVNLVDVVNEYNLTPNGHTFFIITAVKNDLEIECENEKNELKYTESVFVPANCSKLTIRGEGRLMISYSNRKN